MPIVEVEVEGIPELVASVMGVQAELEAGRFLWFRGATQEAHALIPKIMRDGKTHDQVFERELRLLTRFRQRGLAYWPSGYPQSDWEHLFAMQHYGMPTRLLDWSENLFVAAYFALAKFAIGEDGRPVIWCVDPVDWNRAAPNLEEFRDTIHVLTTNDEDADNYRPITPKRRYRTPVAIFGTHNSQRIVAQRGTFFVWGNSTASLQEIAPESRARIWKFTLTAPRGDLAASLQFLGFGETMVFPEMSYLAEELSRAEGWRE